MSVSIVGMGTWLPEDVRSNRAWPETFGKLAQGAVDERIFNDIPASDDPESARILERDLAREAHDPFLGASLRRVARDSDSAREAESVAARAALADAGIPASQVDLVISYSLVPDRVSPTSSAAVAHRIGATSALGFGVDATCATGVIQLEVARAFLESGRAKVVLLTQSHLLLRATPMLHPAAPGLGDAASALVLTLGKGLTLRGCASASHGEFDDSVLWRRGGGPGEDTPWYQAGGPQRLGSYDPAGVKYLMRETVSFGARTVRAAAAAAQLDPERIDVLASVQPRGFIPKAIAERLGLPRETAVTTYDSIAHVGACGPIFNLVQARAEGRLGLGRHAALYAQGAGFTRAASILEVTA
jgi:3-oxoacyl-[acyl-carrier-protein] synthase-3